MRCEARTLDDIRALGGNDAADERCFAAVDRVSQTNLSLYRTFMQPVVRAAATQPSRRAVKSQLHDELMQKRIAELKERIPLGGLREAIIRGLLFVGMARSVVDARGFETVRRIRETESDVPLAAFKAMVREQFYMLLLDTEGALAAIPSMLPDDSRSRRKAFDLIKQVLRARGSYSQQDRERLQQIGRLFGVDEPLLEDDAATRQGKIRRVS